MDYEIKLSAAHKELSEKGVWKSNYNPPIVKLFRKMGLCFPPPYYQSFFGNFALSMVFFAFGWGIFDWLMNWNHTGKPILVAVYTALLIGAIFGLIMATFYLIRRKQLKLSDWDSLGNPPKN